MRRLLLITTLLLNHLQSTGQWCVPTTAIPYAPTMPGITHFVLNSIDRTSAVLEHYPNNSYTNTNLSTELHPGQTYSVSITYTIDPSICPDMNLRVWIDYNKDYQLDDVGETVISVNNQLPGTYTGSFTVPAGTTLQTTRMRVTAKMTPLGGHTLPTPCDVPPDPFGYHGEIEDYDVTITAPTSIDESSISNSFNAFYSNDVIHFTLDENAYSKYSISLFDVSGKLISKLLNDEMISGKFETEINCKENKIAPGVYLAVLVINNEKRVKRLIVE